MLLDAISIGLDNFQLLLTRCKMPIAIHVLLYFIVGVTKCFLLSPTTRKTRNGRQKYGNQIFDIFLCRSISYSTFKFPAPDITLLLLDYYYYYYLQPILSTHSCLSVYFQILRNVVDLKSRQISVCGKRKTEIIIQSQICRRHEVNTE